MIFDRFQAPRILKNTAPAYDFEGLCICSMIALGTDSGPILAPFWYPNSERIGPKRVPKTIKKAIEKLVEFGIDRLTIFEQFWLPTWGGKGSNESEFRGQVCSRNHPGAQMVPRPLIKTGLFVKLGWFLVDVGSIWVVFNHLLMGVGWYLVLVFSIILIILWSFRFQITSCNIKKNILKKASD